MTLTAGGGTVKKAEIVYNMYAIKVDLQFYLHAILQFKNFALCRLCYYYFVIYDVIFDRISYYVYTWLHNY